MTNAAPLTGEIITENNKSDESQMSHKTSEKLPVAQIQTHLKNLK